MIWIAFGRWNHAAGRWFVRDRLYRGGYKWTPFCRVYLRYAPDRLARWVAERLPASVIYWAGIRIWAHATMGSYSGDDCTTLTFPHALNRWQADIVDGGK